jgi:hypothetical protein
VAYSLYTLPFTIMITGGVTVVTGEAGEVVATQVDVFIEYEDSKQWYYLALHSS